MIVLKIIGWILLGILGLVVAVLAIAVIAMCFRVKLNIEYSSENTSVLLKYLFLKIPVYPKSKKEKEAKEADNIKNKPEASEEAEKKQETIAESEEPSDEEKKEEQKDEKSAASSKKKKPGIKDLLETLYNAEGIDGLMLIARRACDYFGAFLGGLKRGVVVDEFDLDVRCSKQDAAQTAIYYGEVCSVIFPLLASLASRCRLKRHDINIYPDYLAKFSSASFILDLHFTPVVMVGHILALGIKFIFGVVLQLVVKIFLYIKNGKKTGNDNKKIKEKSGVTNE